jgi:hypothetical protein
VVSVNKIEGGRRARSYRYWLRYLEHFPYSVLRFEELESRDLPHFSAWSSSRIPSIKV